MIKKLLTNRYTTNLIRFVIDELLPPLIRDNKYFMYPFFCLAYKGKNIKAQMEFKNEIYSYSDEQLKILYQNFNSFANDRPTDLNRASLNYIMKTLKDNYTPQTTVLEVGAGRGYFAKQVASIGFKTTALDVFDNADIQGVEYIKGSITDLPFEDKQFDIVCCNHTLEHIIDIRKAVDELKRVAKKMIIITVPKQRPFYYTLDYHLHFFLRKQMLIELMNMNYYHCTLKFGDYVYVGRK